MASNKTGLKAGHKGNFLFWLFLLLLLLLLLLLPPPPPPPPLGFYSRFLLVPVSTPSWRCVCSDDVMESIKIGAKWRDAG